MDDEQQEGEDSMTIDMWYGDKFVKGKYGADAYFNDLTGKYWGWIYNAHGKIIGDYTTANSVEIEHNFQIKWKGAI